MNAKAPFSILLLNLGSPNSLKRKEVRRYLARFLSDPRVITFTPWLWQPILRILVLPLRSFTSQHKYQSIWTGKSPAPLVAHSQDLAQALEEAFRAQGYNIVVRAAMTYSAPEISEVLQELSGEKLIVLPLFPQYSSTTIGACLDALSKALKGLPDIPELFLLRSFYKEKSYLNALAKSIIPTLEKMQPERLLLSYHGLPIRYVKKGDPYSKECERTTRALQERLQSYNIPVLMSYQSRFGPVRWLGPSTAEVLTKLPKQGVQSICVVAPSFLVDGLETLQELALEDKRIFLQAGGKEFTYIPALNSDSDLVKALYQFIQKEAGL